MAGLTDTGEHDRASQMLGRIQECIARAMKLDPGQAARIGPQATAADVPGWNSVNHLSLILELERTFNIRFENEEIVAMASVPAIIERLAARGLTG